MNGKVQRTEGSIVLLDENRSGGDALELQARLAVQVDGAGLNAKNNEIAMETLEICHEGLEIDGQI